ncbi:MAG: integrase core domain-containing protein [Conexivisphaerales archaeon]
MNQNLERIHSTIREKEKVTRGMDRVETAQILADGMRISYNFVRPHIGLNGKTPAQISGLDLQLEGIRWGALISQAVNSSSGKGA